MAIPTAGDREYCGHDKDGRDEDNPSDGNPACDQAQGSQVKGPRLKVLVVQQADADGDGICAGTLKAIRALPSIAPVGHASQT